MVTAVPAGAEAASELVEQHLHLVQHVVAQMASRYPRHVDRGALWSSGAAALVEAARRFDPATGVPFPRVASIHIRAALVAATRTRDWVPRGVGRRLREDRREVGRASPQFEEAHEGPPATPELTEPAAALEHLELSGTLRTGVGFLPPVQREVVERTFLEGERLRDVADSLGVTEARVSQIRTEALHALRAYFASAFEAVPPVPAGAPGSRQRTAYVAAVSSQTTWRTRLQAGAEDTSWRRAVDA